MNKKLPLAIALLASLSACTTVGPNYHLPDQAAINRPQAKADFSSANHSAFSNDPAMDHWWELYDDPRLNALIEQAFKANTDLRVAAANLDQVRAVLQETAAAGQANIDLSAQADYGHPSGTQLLEFYDRPKDQWLYAGSVGISYDLDLFGKVRRAVEAAEADTQAAQDAFELVHVNVAAQTTRAYVDACAAGMELQSAQQSVDIQAQSVDVEQRLQRAGAATVLDVTRARSQLDILRAALPPLEASRRSSLFQLATLLGKTPNEFPPELAQCDTLPQVRQIIPVGNGADLLRRRPDVREAERKLAAATAKIGVATADLYPDIQLGAQLAVPLTSTTLIGSRSTYAWTAGPLISWSVPGSTGQVRSEIEAANAGAKGQLAQFDGVVLKALRETESSLTVYASQIQRTQALQEARQQSQVALDQANKLYRLGSEPFIDVLDAQRTLASSQSALAAAQAELSSDQINLFLALGGGWQTADADKAPANTPNTKDVQAIPVANVTRQAAQRN